MQHLYPLKEAFEQHADPVRAAGARAYMKNIAPFYGISAPVRTQLLKEFHQNWGYISPESAGEMIEYTWSQTEREWQYAGMEMLAGVARKSDEKLLPLATYMITHKSWWDTVDYIAPNIAGVILKRKPELIPGLISEWMKSGNLWLMRSCLLFQLKYRDNTDEALLFSLCERLAGHNDFFIRKAIGWSLREYSKRKPATVIEFVQSHELSGLSRREALKRIDKL